MSSTAVYSAISFYGLAVLSKSISSLISCLGARYQLSGLIVSPCGGKTYITSHISSPDTYFIDLDPEIFNALDEDDQKASQLSSSSLNVNRIIYQKGKEVVKDLLEMINGTSKSFSVKKICFLSTDYRLLKYLGVSCISYTLGSSVYYESIQGMSDEKKVALAKYKDDLTKNKGGKLIVYNSLSDLLNVVMQKYDVSLRV